MILFVLGLHPFFCYFDVGQYVCRKSAKKRAFLSNKFQQTSLSIGLLANYSLMLLLLSMGFVENLVN